MCCLAVSICGTACGVSTARQRMSEMSSGIWRVLQWVLKVGSSVRMAVQSVSGSWMPVRACGGPVNHASKCSATRLWTASGSVSVVSTGRIKESKVKVDLSVAMIRGMTRLSLPMLRKFSMRQEFAPRSLR